MTLGEYIKKYRTEHELSGRAFAELAGMSNQYVSNLERGRNNSGGPISPTMETYAKVARATGISEIELLKMLNDEVLVNPRGEMSAKERIIIQKYRSLDEYGKKAVEAVLEAEASRKVIDLNEYSMVARGGKKIPEGMEDDMRKMLGIMFPEE